MSEKTDVWQGTLALMVLKTLEALGPLHGYGIARRIEQISENKLAINYGTIYPALLKLEQEGFVASEWGVSENNRKAKFYKLTKAGHKQVEKEAREWERTTAIYRHRARNGSRPPGSTTFEAMWSVPGRGATTLRPAWSATNSPTTTCSSQASRQ